MLVWEKKTLILPSLEGNQTYFVTFNGWEWTVIGFYGYCTNSPGVREPPWGLDRVGDSWAGAEGSDPPGMLMMVTARKVAVPERMLKMVRRV